MKGKSPKKIRHLLIIDPQNDFCDPAGALFVTGADEDMKVRLPRMIKRVKEEIDDIHVTLDSHHSVHVAHPISWVGRDGSHPAPFTTITLKDVQEGVWRASIAGMQARFQAYVKALADHGRYELCIWPPHCLIGHPGNNVVPELWEALKEWEDGFAVVDYVTKGSNIYTEHYSALVADVPDPKDPGTQLNTGLIRTLLEADEIGVAGEALSHCLANTVTDLANNFGDDSYISKLVLLIDCCSNVGGPAAAVFKKMGDDFISAMVKRGMKRSTSVEWLS